MDNINIGYEIKYIYIDGKMTMYRLFYWKNRYIEVKVNQDAEITVYANKKDTIEDIEKEISNKKGSILYWNQHKEKILINYQNNSLTILGKKYTLKPISRRLKNGFDILGNVIYINASTNEQKYELTKKIFDSTAGEYLRSSTNKWAKKMGLPLVKNIQIKWVRGFWGRCNCNVRNPRIEYSYLLCPHDKKVVDSVIVHELCHFRFPNHKRPFWDEVLKWDPDNYKWDKILNAPYRSGTLVHKK